MVCERIKLNRTDVVSLIMHALKDIAEKVCKKKPPPPKQSNVGFLTRQKMSQLFPLDNIWPGMGAKADRPDMSPPDRNRNPYKKPTDYFSFFYLCYVAIRTYYTWAFLSLSLHMLPSEFASRSYSTHTRQQCLPLCVIFSTTRHGSMPLSHTHRHNTIRQCFVSLYQPHLHVRWQRLPLSVMLNTIKNGSVCPSGSHST